VYFKLPLAVALLALSGCMTIEGGSSSANDPTRPRVYRISALEAPRIQNRMLESVNALRQAAGVPPLALNGKLSNAAAAHSKDMAGQQRPWNFGVDGTTPLERAARAGFEGALLGQAFSETYETEMETLAAWMGQTDTREVLLEPRARNMGFSFYQEPTGKIWWTLMTGT